MPKGTIGLALGSGILFGMATPASKPLLDSMGPFVLAGLLYLGAALALALRQGRKREPLRPSAEDRGRLLGSIVLGGVVGPVLLLFGLRLALAGSVSVWLNLELAWTAVLGIAVFRERIGAWTWAAVACVVLASLAVGWTGQGVGPLAVALVALACLAWAFDNQFTSHINSITAPSMTLWKGAAAGTTNLVIGLLLEGPPLASAIPLALLLGAVSYGVSIVWYVMAARRIGATRAQVAFSTAPMWGILGSLLVLHEAWTWRIGLATALVMACVVLLWRGAEVAAAPREPMAPA